MNVIEAVGTRLASSNRVEAVFGAPIAAEGKTIIPVASVAYGFGGGGGTEHAGEEGYGGGGGGSVSPIGVVEVSIDDTRFIPVESPRRWLGAALFGLVVGFWLGRR